MPPILSKFNRFQLEDGFIKHAQLAVSVGAGQAGAEVHGGLLPHVVQSLHFSGGQGTVVDADIVEDRGQSS